MKKRSDYCFVMASFWSPPRCKCLIACWTDGNGRGRKRSTKTTDKELANRFEEVGRGKRTVKQSRRVLADIFHELSGDQSASLSTRKCFTNFIAQKKLEVSQVTPDQYNGHSRRFLKWLGTKADGDISEITTSEINAYRNAAAEKVGSRSTNNILQAIKIFFAAARKDGCLSDGPVADVESVRDWEVSRRHPFALDELRALMAVDTDEWRSMILLGLYTGQRLSDIATITWQNIDTGQHEIRPTTRKTGRRLTIPLANYLRTHIATLTVGDDPKAALHLKAASVMTNNGGSGPLSNAFAALLGAAGLRATASAEKGNARARHELSFHSLRHTATSLLKAAAVPQSVVMAYIGHDSADVSQGCTHTGKDALTSVAASLPAL